MNTRYALFTLGLLSWNLLSAQSYCSPTFLNGCTLWRNLSVNVGTINWVAGSDCFVSDFTSQSTVLTPGVAEPMTVSSGNWTGCAVWVDLNNNQNFEDSENLFHQYVGGDPSFTYNFTITLPPGTPAGSYRMRIIAGWGTDGFTPGSINGYGPCGNYQYGNFNDFTVVVSGSTAVAAQASSPLRISPNPTADRVTVVNGTTAVIAHVELRTLDGRLVMDLPVAGLSGPISADLSTLPCGTYLLTGRSQDEVWTTRVVKE
ncbi:MAG: T9SS type A sorting domain-containing protein [Flavobacteriales bacterium]|nr:T9SS type A sorting domain-containing protein [Flavobacteriales bacterium]